MVRKPLEQRMMGMFWLVKADDPVYHTRHSVSSIYGSPTDRKSDKSSLSNLIKRDWLRFQSQMQKGDPMVPFSTPSACLHCCFLEPALFGDASLLTLFESGLSLNANPWFNGESCHDDGTNKSAVFAISVNTIPSSVKCQAKRKQKIPDFLGSAHIAR